jgi:hypothetical protein
MRAHAIATRPLVRDELVALMREGARAVGLEVFARPAAVEVGARLLAGLVGLAVGLDGLDSLDVTELVVVVAFRLQVPPANTKKGCGIPSSLREQSILTASTKNIAHVLEARGSKSISRK